MPTGTCGLGADGAAYCLGSGYVGDSTYNMQKADVPVIGGLKFESISAGMSSTCGATISGALYCWGTPGLR